MALSENDPNSFSRPGISYLYLIINYIVYYNKYVWCILLYIWSISFTDLAVITHVHLELNVDFNRKVLSGKAILDIEKKGATNTVVRN